MNTLDGKLGGKIALITGGTTGIGLATAQRFVQEGAHVFIIGRRQAELNAAVALVGGCVTGIQGDVANADDLNRLFAQIQAEKGHLDIIFAAVGAASFASVGVSTRADFDELFNGSVKGLLFTVQKALPLLPDGASIILMSSVVGSKGVPADTVYSATKAALRSLARTWTTDPKERKIRVNALSSGPLDTEGLRALAGSTDAGQEQMQSLGAAVLLGRLGHPDEIAKAAVFLASDDSRFVTGTELSVDGGLAQMMKLSTLTVKLSLLAAYGALTAGTIMDAQASRGTATTWTLMRTTSRHSSNQST